MEPPRFCTSVNWTIFFIIIPFSDKIGIWSYRISSHSHIDIVLSIPPLCICIGFISKGKHITMLLFRSRWYPENMMRIQIYYFRNKCNILHSDGRYWCLLPKMYAAASSSHHHKRDKKKKKRKIVASQLWLSNI